MPWASRSEVSAPSTTTPFGPYDSCSDCNNFTVSRLGTFQVAQKPTSTTLPLRVALVTVLSFRSGSENSGSGLPTNAAGPGPVGPSTPAVKAPPPLVLGPVFSTSDGRGAAGPPGFGASLAALS